MVSKLDRVEAAAVEHQKRAEDRKARLEGMMGSITAAALQAQKIMEALNGQYDNEIGGDMLVESMKAAMAAGKHHELAAEYRRELELHEAVNPDRKAEVFDMLNFGPAEQIGQIIESLALLQAMRIFKPAMGCVAVLAQSAFTEWHQGQMRAALALYDSEQAVEGN